MEWQQIAKVIVLLFITAGIVTAIVLLGTGKVQNNNNIDTEIGYVSGYALLIILFIFISNELLIKSAPSNRLYVEWGMIYLTLIMAYISIGVINITQLGGSIGAGTAKGTVAAAAAAAAGGTSSCCATCCNKWN